MINNLEGYKTMANTTVHNMSTDKIELTNKEDSNLDIVLQGNATLGISKRIFNKAKNVFLVTENCDEDSIIYCLTKLLKLNDQKSLVIFKVEDTILESIKSKFVGLGALSHDKEVFFSNLLKRSVNFKLVVKSESQENEDKGIFGEEAILKSKMKLLGKNGKGLKRKKQFFNVIKGDGGRQLASRFK